jgi:hypothetical protein
MLLLSCLLLLLWSPTWCPLVGQDFLLGGTDQLLDKLWLLVDQHGLKTLANLTVEGLE